MVVRRDKKVKKQRGNKTHGYGSMKKNRGAGNRGGRGNAGSGKRGDSKKPTLWKNGKKLGKFGFKSKARNNNEKIINIKTLEMKMHRFVEEKKAEANNGTYIVDLSKMGYSKLLGTGTPKLKMEVTIEKASAKTIEKIKAIGGKINIKTKV